MLELLFKQPSEDFKTYNTVATLHINDDGTHTIDGDVGVAALEVPVLGPKGQIIFKNAPADWARHAHRAFRTPYLVTELIEL